jgi:hypothetical protein
MNNVRIIFVCRQWASVCVRRQLLGPAGLGPQGRGDAAQLRQVAQTAPGHVRGMWPRPYRIRDRCHASYPITTESQ